MMEKNTPYLEIKSLGDDGVFEGYASVFAIKDFHNDVIPKGAFEKSLTAWHKMGQLPKLLWQHDHCAPIGKWLVIQEDDHGLFVRGQLLLDLQKGREAYTLLRAGCVDGLSIGFNVLRARKGQGVRLIQEIDLQEISLVTFAANERARVTAVKDRRHGLYERWLKRLIDLQGLLTGDLFSSKQLC